MYFLHLVNNFHENTKWKEEIKEELTVLDMLLKRNSETMSVLVYKNPAHTNE